MIVLQMENKDADFSGLERPFNVSTTKTGRLSCPSETEMQGHDDKESVILT